MRFRYESGNYSQSCEHGPGDCPCTEELNFRTPAPDPTAPREDDTTDQDNN
ncbi:hypothetical protein ACIQJX_07615 [Streptomyces griseoviridis]